MNLTAQLEELHLIKCSLLPGEVFSISLPEEEAAQWTSLIDDFTEGSLPAKSEAEPESTCRFRIRIENGSIALEFELPRDYPSDDGCIKPNIFVRGARDDQILAREEQVKWQKIVKDKLAEVQTECSELVIQTLISEHLIPLLHAESSTVTRPTSKSPTTPSSPKPTSISRPPVYHALLTSHHLISPTKRRNLAKWCSDLHLRGFAKVGYPGVIYVESSSRYPGSYSEDVEEFVRRVKGMQWLALRLRFVEVLEVLDGYDQMLRLRERDGKEEDVDWLELEKVGEVVEVMRCSGRERYVTEMGLGSAGTNYS